MSEKNSYVGLQADLANGDGITPIARIILDARVFKLIPGTETCKGWTASEIQSLYEKVNQAWEPYGSLPSNLPDDLRRHHANTYSQAIKECQDSGWDPMRDLENER